MRKILPSSKMYIGNSKILNAGRGVFATQNITKNEIIEICPFIEIPEDDPANLFGSKLVTYFFFFGKNKEKSALILGDGSLYNHSDRPNARLKINQRNKTVIITALKNIKKNEEITFNYKDSSKQTSTKKLWFE